jgi:hypothetical protein
MVGAIGIIILLYLVRRAMDALRRPEMSGMTPEKVRKTWEEIGKTAGQGVMGMKLAIIEADRLLDAVLKSMMMPGETMAERLKVAQYKYPDLKRVWYAHKLRNQLVHESSFELRSRDGQDALKHYRDALKTLHVL